MKKKLFVISLALMLALIMTAILPLYATDETTEAESNSQEITYTDSVTDAAITAVIPDSAESFLVFEGYQVRETDYNGLRAIFKINIADMPTLDTDGVEVIEYGTAIASTDLLTNAGANLTVSKGEDGEYATVSYGKLFPIMKNGKFVGKLLKNTAECVEYACTVTNFTVNTFEKNVTCRGYAVLCDANGEEYVVYSDYFVEDYRSVNLGQMCDEMLADGTITSSNISYKNVVSFREQLKEEEGWGPIWKP